MAIRHLCSADVWSPEVRTTGDGGFFGLWKPENPAQGPRGHPAGLQRALGSRGVMWRRVDDWRKTLALEPAIPGSGLLHCETPTKCELPR